MASELDWLVECHAANGEDNNCSDSEPLRSYFEWAKGHEGCGQHCNYLGMLGGCTADRCDGDGSGARRPAHAPWRPARPRAMSYVYSSTDAATRPRKGKRNGVAVVSLSDSCPVGL